MFNNHAIYYDVQRLQVNCLTKYITVHAPNIILYNQVISPLNEYVRVVVYFFQYNCERF